VKTLSFLSALLVAASLLFALLIAATLLAIPSA
jgi:hypothetical protein